MIDLSALLKTGNSFIRLQDPRITVEVKSFQTQLENNRVEQLETLIKTVTEVCKTLEYLKTDVFKCGTKNLDIETLKKKLIDLEEKIVNTKQGIKDQLAEVSENEVKFSKDLKFWEKRMEDWSKPVNPQFLKPIKQSIYKVETQYDDPTAEFQKFLLNFGGHCGGWLEQDHLLFLRERRKQKEKNKFITAVQNLLPDLSIDDISAHEDWYAKYESLRSAQKEAILKWRTKKQQEEEKKTENNELEEKNETKTNKRVVNQINIAERIKEWKKQQLAKKVEEKERQKKEERQLQQEREKMKEMQRIKKQAVNQYKAEKLFKMHSDALLEKERKSQMADKTRNSILLKSFRLQDIKFIEKKKMIKLQLESKNASKVERLKLAKSPFDFLLQRDPQRIFKPTVIWSQHCQSKEDRQDKFNNGFNLNTIPRLAIPEWRRELK